MSLLSHRQGLCRSGKGRERLRWPSSLLLPAWERSGPMGKAIRKEMQEPPAARYPLRETKVQAHQAPPEISLEMLSESGGYGITASVTHLSPAFKPSRSPYLWRVEREGWFKRE